MNSPNALEPLKVALNIISLGETNAQTILGNTLDVLFRQPMQKTWVDRLKEPVQLARICFGLKNNPAPGIPSLQKPWYIVSSNRHHFTAFMEPIKEVDSNRIIVGHQMSRGLDWSTEYTHPSARKEFIHWLTQEWKKSKPHLMQVYNQFGLSVDMKRSLNHTVQMGMFRYINARNWLKQLAPINLLTEYDREFKTTTWLAAANHLGIPTFTMVHGSTYPIVNYVPTTAQTILAWGNKQKKHFEEAGIDPNDVVAAGNTRAKQASKIDGKLIRKRLNVSPNDTVAVLISNNIDIEHRLQLASCFAKGRKEGITRIIKLHPREKLEDYDGLSSSDKDVLNIIPSDACTAEEAIEMGDFFVGHNSVMLLECVMMGKPIIVLDIIPMNSGIGEELAVEGRFPLIGNVEKWISEIENMNDPHYRNNRMQGAEKLIQSHCIRRGNNAAKWIVDFINSKS